MGSKKKPNFPGTPSFQPFPTVSGDITQLSTTGRSLATGGFLDPNDPTTGFLNENVTLNPEITRQAIDLASRDTIELRDRAQQDILNQLEANNQLTSSVTGDSLSQLNKSFSSDIADIATNFRLADQQRALESRLNLFGVGLNTLQTSTSLGQEQQAQQNSFALQKFDRDFAIEAERFNRASSRPTFGSIASGALGGGISGFVGSGGNPLGAAAGAFGGGLTSAFGTNTTGTTIGTQGLSDLSQREIFDRFRRESGTGFGSTQGVV